MHTEHYASAPWAALQELVAALEAQEGNEGGEAGIHSQNAHQMSAAEEAEQRGAYRALPEQRGHWYTCIVLQWPKMVLNLM